MQGMAEGDWNQNYWQKTMNSPQKFSKQHPLKTNSANAANSKLTAPTQISRTALAAVFARRTMASDKTANTFGRVASYDETHPQYRCPVERIGSV